MDSKDFLLLTALHRDARRSYQSLGRAVGLSAPAVRDRLTKLRESGILTGYGLWVDPAVFDRQEVLVFFGRERSRDEVLKLLREDEVAWIGWKLDGGLTIGVWTKDTEKSVSHLERVLGEKSAGHAATEIRSLPPLSNLDRAIADALADSPRIPFGSLVEKTGLSPKTVRRHLSALLESETMEIIPLLGAISGSGDLVYQLAVVGEAPMSAIRNVLRDAILLHQTYSPPMKYLLCRSSDIGEVTSMTREIGRLAGVEKVTLSLNRELLFSPRLVHTLLKQRAS